MTKRKYRTDEEWLSLIQECRLSGLTDKQWCEAHQICPYQTPGGQVPLTKCEQKFAKKSVIPPDIPKGH